MDPSTGPTRSPISTNLGREMLLFLARVFVSHAGITNNGSAHTDSLSFLVQSPQQNGCMGAYTVIDLEQFPVRISTDKADTTNKIWDLFFLFVSSSVTLIFFFSFFSFFFFFFSFFLSFFLFFCIAHRLLRFMAFQSVLGGTTPAFTIIINGNKDNF